MKFYENLLVELALMASPLAAIPVSAVSWSYRVSGNLVGISINLCKSIQKELFINDTP